MDKQKNNSNINKKRLFRACSYFDEDAPEIALKSLFRKYDSDENEMLDRDELFSLLQDDLGLSEEQCDIYHHLLDKNGDGLISYKEFRAWLRSNERFQTITDKCRYYYLQKAIVIFQKFDTDQDMCIDKNEFHSLFVELGGANKNAEDEHVTMDNMDLNQDGRISFEEFMRWLNWVPLEYLIVE